MDDVIDESILPLVEALNNLPGIETFSSCGGHPAPLDVCQRPEGAFYVGFYVARSTEYGWKSLAAITLIVTATPGLSLRVWYNGLISWRNDLPDIDAIDPDVLCFQLDGEAFVNRSHLVESLHGNYSRTADPRALPVGA